MTPYCWIHPSPPFYWSPVFERMFEQSGFLEHSKRESEIRNMDVITLKALLTFIYSNKIESENIPDLFIAADIYDVQVCNILPWYSGGQSWWLPLPPSLFCMCILIIFTYR